MSGDGDDELPSDILTYNVNDYLVEYTLQGKWKKVVSIYNIFPEAHTAMIDESTGTALHVAVDLDEEAVADLVRAIINHEEEVVAQAKRRAQEKAVQMKNERGDTPMPEEEVTKISMYEELKALQGLRTGGKMPLEMVNERGDTPLHVAASRGFAKLCKCIIGENNERIYLLRLKNKEGETPLLLAALNWRKEAFAYLSHISADSLIWWMDLVRNNGDSILHCAIQREYFDLAVIIMHHYDAMSIHRNNEEASPLKVLATRPSAFRSGINLSWWKQILYHCTHVEQLEVESARDLILRKMEQPPHSDKMNLPKNYTTCYDFFSKFAALVGKLLSGKNQCDTENPTKEENHQVGFLPPNYATIQQFVRSAYVRVFALLGVDLKTTKQKHKWADQLLKKLMERPDAIFASTGGQPPDLTVEPDMWNVFYRREAGLAVPQLSYEEQNESSETAVAGSKTATPEGNSTNKETKPNKHEIDKKETAFLVAARNGIVEMVNEILALVPSAIHHTNSVKENVLLVAVKNRQPLVVETLRMRMMSKPEVWNNLILAVDKDENTMLHLAAHALGDDTPLRMAGSALQMMWDINWFQYIKSLVPDHFYFRTNNKEKGSKTAEEIFKESHKKLVEESSAWLKDTSESCSVVAALIAGVSFATASAVPGGTNSETGKPALEGQPAFDAFAIASLIGLCFSVTGLIMFLSILTSRKQAKDFSKGLPLKLLLGLSSLFVSIAAMFVSFCSGHLFVLKDKYKHVLFPMYAATCLPLSFYAIAQFPLYVDLLITIFTKVPYESYKGEGL